MVGGNAGFALGPLLAALFIPLLDERATLVFLVPGIAVSLWLYRAARTRLTVAVPAPARARSAPRPRQQLRTSSCCCSSPACAPGPCSACSPWRPLLLVDDRGYSDQAAGFAVAAFAGAGAVGTVAGAALADRVGGRRMLLWTLPAVAPLIAGFLLTDGAVSIVLFTAAGFVALASFSVTVMMGQEYLPDRLALAAGLMIGFGAIGVGACRASRCSARSPTRPGARRPSGGSRPCRCWRGAVALLLPQPARAPRRRHA